MPSPLCAAGRWLPQSLPRATRQGALPRRRYAVRSVGQGNQGGYVPSTPNAEANAALGNPSISGVAGSGFQPQSGSQTASEDKPSASELKAVLLDSLYGTERGLSASMELRGEISELISQLEAANPNTDDPNDAQLLGGTWKLVYTAASELGALLALSRLPFVTVGDITQTIEVATGRVVNKVVLSDVFTRSAFSSTANFEVRSPKLLSIKFVSGALATPQLLQDVDLPQSITLLGQNVDLTAVREALSPARQSVQTAVSQVSAFLEGRPDTKFDLPEQVQAQSWLLTTYIDEDVRIARGDGGAVFVLVRESQPDTPTTPATPAGNSGFGTYGTGAWKDDPIGNRPPSTPAPIEPTLNTPFVNPPSTAPFNEPPSIAPSEEAAPPPDAAPPPPPAPPSQESTLPPSIAPLLTPPPPPPQSAGSSTVKPTSLNVGGEGRRANPGDVLGISMGQRKVKKTKKKGGSNPNP